MKKSDIMWLVLALVLTFLVGAIIGLGLGVRRQENHQEKVIEKKIQEVYVEGEELSEWDILTMAIMKTESEYDPGRIGSSNDVGILQCTPIYVEEVNRILRMDEANDKEYGHLDAFDVRKSIEMFNIVQNYHNPNKDISKAITQHNPGGASIGYGKKVYDNIRFIKRLEEARKELLKYEIEVKLNQLEE